MKHLCIRNQYGLGMVLITGIIPGHPGVIQVVDIMEADTEEVEDIGVQVGRALGVREDEVLTEVWAVVVEDLVEEAEVEEAEAVEVGVVVEADAK
jgi:hypothetical protein